MFSMDNFAQSANFSRDKMAIYARKPILLFDRTKLVTVKKIKALVNIGDQVLNLIGNTIPIFSIFWRRDDFSNNRPRLS